MEKVFYLFVVYVANTIRTQKFSSPAILPSLDFLDQMNYRHFGYSALRITHDTFYRNRSYHKPSGTMETLDVRRMA